MSTRSGAAAVRARRGHKERSKNFTELEKRTVLELIARHRDVLRQGRSNNATNRSKQLVWSRICEEVNQRCGGERPRTPAQVKMWYENYKKKCKMRAQDSQHPTQETSGLLDGMLWQSIHPLEGTEDDGEAAMSAEGVSVKDEDCLPVNMCNSSGRSPFSTPCSSPRVSPRALEPHVTILHARDHHPPARAASPAPAAHPLQAMEQVRLQNLSYLQKLNELSNTPLNLSHLDNDERRNGEEKRERESERHECGSATEEERLQNLSYLQKLNELSNTPLNLSHLDNDERRNGEEKRERESERHECGSATEEERSYYSARRQHAIWEHEAKMRILNMELKQKEEIFSLQKQLFLIELKLKMDFLEKASAK